MINRAWKISFALTAILLPGSLMCAQRRASASSLPAGTPVIVRINEHLSSETAHAGDTFTGSLARPLIVNGRTQFSQGTAVTGRVIAAQPSGRLSDPGVLELRLVSVGSSNISSRPFVIRGASHTKSNVAKIGGSTAAGAVIGAIAGGGKGAAIGAGVGAGAGTATAATTGKKPATVEPEAVLEFLVGDAGQDSRILRSSEPAYSDHEPYDPNAGGYVVYEHRRRHHDDDDDDDQGEDDDHDHDREWDSHRYDRYIFTEQDMYILRGCLADYEFESLPPGIQKKLARGGTLPPGQAKKLRRLPGSCTTQLEPLPGDVDRIIYGNRIILVGGSHIIDIFIYER